jgi:hypothetical protein
MCRIATSGGTQLRRRTCGCRRQTWSLLLSMRSMTRNVLASRSPPLSARPPLHARPRQSGPVPKLGDQFRELIVDAASQPQLIKPSGGKTSTDDIISPLLMPSSGCEPTNVLSCRCARGEEG